MALTKINNNSLSAVTTLPAGVGGKVLQVVYGSISTPVAVTSNTYTDTGFTTSITPSATNNHIYLNWFMPDNRKETNNTNMNMKIYRQVNGGGYSALVQVNGGHMYNGGAGMVSAGIGAVYKDTTYNSIAQVDYKIYFNSGQNAATVTSNKDGTSQSGIMAMEVQS